MQSRYIGIDFCILIVYLSLFMLPPPNGRGFEIIVKREKIPVADTATAKRYVNL